MLSLVFVLKETAISSVDNLFGNQNSPGSTIVRSLIKQVGFKNNGYAVTLISETWRYYKTELGVLLTTYRIMTIALPDHHDESLQSLPTTSCWYTQESWIRDLQHFR